MSEDDFISSIVSILNGGGSIRKTYTTYIITTTSALDAFMRSNNISHECYDSTHYVVDARQFKDR